MTAPAPTSPWNIPLFDDNSPFDPIQNVFNSQSQALNTALNNLVSVRQIQTFKWANDAERNAQTGMVNGDEGYQTDTNTGYKYVGGVWQIESTEWVTATLASGITVTAGRVAPQYRLRGRSVEIVGCVDGSSASAYALLTLPVGFRPAGQCNRWASVGSYVQITPDGVVSSTLTGTKSAVDFSGIFPVA